MATSLSTYWVKFFSGAGFPLDVATKHAVVFSNNRIKPDMLPDLDKPSLKEMGITLMGDMIAILRYAKKVSDEMTCERFLVDTADHVPPMKTINTKPVLRKVASKVSSVGNKSVVASKSPSGEIVKDTLKVTKKCDLSSVTVVPKKKLVKKVTDESCQELQTKKRKTIAEIETIDSESEEEWPSQVEKRLKVQTSNDTVEYKILPPKTQTVKIQESKVVKKKILDQKRTVFDRLGDSSVTSTTNLADVNTTFNITGLGSDVLKRNSSVFNRLGDINGKNDTSTAGILKNGSSTSNGQPQGILKSRISNIGTTTIKLTKTPGVSTAHAGKKIPTGTMHADHERNHQKVVSSSVKQLVRKTKALMPKKIIRKVPVSKLASERVSTLPAKSRLGLTDSQKCVTFNKVTTVAHIKKPGVFSRLGI